MWNPWIWRADILHQVRDLRIHGFCYFLGWGSGTNYWQILVTTVFLIVTKRADPENPLHKKKNMSLYMGANVS